MKHRVREVIVAPPVPFGEKREKVTTNDKGSNAAAQVQICQETRLALLSVLLVDITVPDIDCKALH